MREERKAERFKLVYGIKSTKATSTQRERRKKLTKQTGEKLHANLATAVEETRLKKGALHRLSGLLREGRSKNRKCVINLFTSARVMGAENNIHSDQGGLWERKRE